MTLVVAVVMWLLLVLLPGVAVLRLVPTDFGFGRSVALAAPVSVALLFLVGRVAPHLGLPLVKTCAAVAAGVTLAWIVVELLRLRTAGITWPAAKERISAAGRTFRRDRYAVANLVLLTAAIALGVGLWTAVHAKLSVPAGWDAMHHGYFVRQILRYDTLKASVVLSSDPTRPDGTASFYPLAPHLIAAIISAASGIHVSTVLFAMTVAFGGVVLPIGMFALAQRLGGARSVLPGLAGVASVLPASLYSIDSVGRLTTVVGLAMAPALVTMLLTLRGRRTIGRSAACALAVVGLIEAHTSELPFCVGLALLVFAADALRSRQWGIAGRQIALAAGVGVVALAVLAVADPGIRYLVGQRSGVFAAHSSVSLSTAIRFFTVRPELMPSSAGRSTHVWMALALVGCLATIHPRWHRLRAAAVAYLGFIAFGIAWAAGYLGGLRVLADPWYQSQLRMLWELCLLGAIPVAVAVAAGSTLVVHVVGWATSRLTRPARIRTVAVIALLGALGIAGAQQIFPPTRSMSRWASTHESPVGPDAQAAFRFLHRQVRPGERVLDDLELHGDLWMYDDYGVPTVFGNPPLIGFAPRSWKVRLYARGKLSHLDADGCVSEALRANDVRYVYYSRARMFNGRTHFALYTLSNRKQFREVFQRGAAYVYEVLLPPTDRPCRNDPAALFPWNTQEDAR